MNHFEPSAARARDLRLAMDASLWDSVRDVFADLGIDPALRNPAGESANSTHLLDYAAYFDLIREEAAGFDEIKAHAVAHLRGRLAVDILKEPISTAPRISNYDLRHYTAEQLAQLSRWWDTEPDNRMALTAAGDREWNRSREAIDRALHYLRQAAPEQHAEVEIVVRDIVLAKPDGSNLIEYGGASSFGLWGALSINAESQSEWTDFYRQIVHETGHNLLFAIARNEPLMHADSSVRRFSPLRAQPRPLDGIFHAAYVSAREALAFEALLDWHERGGDLSEEDVERVLEELERSVTAFWACVATLRGEGAEGPTELGAAVLSDCEAFMSETFALEPC